jgi:fimbrial chaperone protein
MNFLALARRGLCATLLATAATGAIAAPFEIAVAPSRFELSGRSGARLGQSLDIHNVGATATEVALRTLDWTYSTQGDISYHDALQSGSCRPWVTLERRTVTVAPRSKASFRFQIDPPADMPPGECRFMIAVEGVEPAYRAALGQGSTSLSIPVSGRIAVAVYFAVNGAEPKLNLQEVGMKDMRGQRMPALTVTNTGNAHGRLDGSLDATDAKGLRFELVPEGTPIMPGQTRTLALQVKGDGQGKVPVPAYPLKASGLIDWDKGAFRVNAEFR